MSNVVDIGCITTLDLDPDRILEKAIGELKQVVVIGWKHDGGEYFASSKADGGDVLWMLERAKILLLQIPDKGE